MTTAYQSRALIRAMKRVRQARHEMPHGPQFAEIADTLQWLDKRMTEEVGRLQAEATERNRNPEQ